MREPYPLGTHFITEDGEDVFWCVFDEAVEAGGLVAFVANGRVTRGSAQGWDG